MATYVIGDVQGCFTELVALLGVIDYHPQYDRLGFTGDLVNRGPDSLKTLRFIAGLPDPIVVLGNHDFYLLALASGEVQYDGDHSLDQLLNAPDINVLCQWLKQQPLLYYNEEFDVVLTHAGIPPQWDLAQAQACAAEVSQQLQGEKFPEFMRELFGDQPNEWHDDLQGYARWRYIVNAFTRMRFCSAEGKLDLTNKTAHQQDSQLQPWFRWYALSQRMLFGHWAALQGRCKQPQCEALDTGCVWGRGLTAYRIEDGRKFYVPAMRSNTTVL